MSAEGNCPACGAPLVFRVDTSVVVVCGHCSSVVARGDAAWRDMGKASEVLATPSPLAIGLKGRFRDRAYEVVGRTQLKHPAGGFWDEWYLDFGTAGAERSGANAAPQWGWLAEHQGRRALLVETPMNQAPALASLDDATPGKRLVWSRGELQVAERGVATVAGEEGELPWMATPNERRAFVDLSGPGGAFGTLDFGRVDASGRARGPTRFYFGREVSLADLGIAEKPMNAPKLRRVEANKQLRCPKCGGPLVLRTPERSESVVCPSCASVLSLEDDDNLGFLFQQDRGKFKPKIAIGKKAVLLGNRYEVTAFVVRGVVFDGVEYLFEEYLLFNEKLGFRWLVQSDGHWSLAEVVNPGDVMQRSGYSSASYDDRSYRPYQESQPRVRWVEGELYWRLQSDERSNMLDLIAPPHMLSRENTDDEQIWTHATYLPVSAVADAFEVKLAGPSGIGANQPNPYTETMKKGPVLVALAALVVAFFCAVAPTRTLYRGNVALSTAIKAEDKTQTVDFDALPLSANRAVAVSIQHRGVGYMYVNGTLFHKASGTTTTFAMDVGAGTTEVARIPSHLAGTHSLSLRFTRQFAERDDAPTITVKQGAPGTGPIANVVIYGVCGFVLFIVLWGRFENKRKENSNL